MDMPQKVTLMQKKILTGKKLEWVMMALFIALHIVITVFHEPWFDEAQAWQIARCANIREILFEIPHYEGHPPLWFLILAIPAKAGVPFEIGLKTVGFVIAATSAYLMLFRLPYPRVMRLLLPFSFFLFYQYGIIVRPYGLMLLTLLLLALAFPQKDTHPWRFMALMALLCMTCAYGIVIAGGIALAMVWDLVREKGFVPFIHGLFRDQRTLALGSLLVVALLLIADIMPRGDTLITSENPANSFFIRLLCSLFTFIGESTLTTSSWFKNESFLLQSIEIPPLELVAYCAMGLVIWLVIIGASSKRTLKYILFPYSLYTVFSAAVYATVHHTGIALLLLLFWLGILFRDDRRYEIGKALAERVSLSPKDQTLVKRVVLVLGLLSLVIPIYWSASSMALEVQYQYSYGRQGSTFLKAHHLEDSRILSYWAMSASITNNDEDLFDGQHNIYYVSVPVPLNAYFDHNICMNLNDGRDDEAYMHYKRATDAEASDAIDRWKSAGVPEILLGQVPVQKIYDGVSKSDYTVVTMFQTNYILKNRIFKQMVPVYARNDVLDQYGLEPFDDAGVLNRLEGLQVTDEMKEQYENGVPVEEILKPYLDAMFGEED